MIHNPNSPWRKKNNNTKITAGSEEELSNKINELLKRGFNLINKWEESPKDVATSINTGTGHQRRFYGTYMKRYYAVMKRGE